MAKTGTIAAVVVIVVIVAAAAVLLSMQGTPSQTTVTTTATTTETTTTATTTTTEQFKLALMLPDVITDLTWNGPAYQAATRLQADGIISSYSYTEQVQVPDAVRIASGYANEGYDLIVQHGAQFVDTTREAAEANPDSYFVTTALPVTGYPSNAATTWVYLEEAYYQLGILAGRMTQSNVVGILSPLEIPGITEWCKGFKLGVHSVNPSATVLYAVTGSFMDATLGKEAALGMIEAGADFLAPMTDGPALGAILAAGESTGVYVFGNEGDTHAINPSVVVSSAIWDSYSAYKQIVLDIKAGTFKTAYAADTSTGGSTITPFYALKDDIPQSVIDEMNTAKQKIISGEINVKELVADVTL